MHDKLDELEEHESLIISDKKQLMQDKLTLTAKIEKMYADNAKLATSVNGLRKQNDEIQERNSELVRINKLLTDDTSVSRTEKETISAGFLPPAGIPTNTYRCEDYSGFAQNSEQNMLQDDCFTDEATGIRYYIDDAGIWYCAALAGAYGTEIGHCYTFKLANGYFIHVIQADFKHDISSPRSDDYGDDDVNYDGEKCINVIEFVVDMDKIPASVKQAGTMSALDEFGGLYGDGGNIVNVIDEGRRWKP